MDPNCFYAEGCAIAHGYLPYKDFIDVKGPLLFLIYTIGYLLTPTHCFGIFFLYVLATWGTLLAFFRTAELFSLSTRSAILATALATCCLFSRCTAFWAAQPEQLMVLPLSWTLYYFTAFLKEPGGHFHRPLAWWLSSGATCTFLIKYNFVLPYAAIFCLTLYLMVQRHSTRNIIPFIIRCLIASALICLPFILYFSYHGLWNDFYDAYFMLNLHANGPSTASVSDHIIKLRLKLTTSSILLSYLIFEHALIRGWFSRSGHIKDSIMKSLTPVFLATFLSCYIGTWGYYFIMMAPTAIFLCLDIANNKRVVSFLQHHIVLKSVAFSFIFIFVVNAFCISTLGWMRPDNSAAKIAQVQEMMARITYPKVIYCDCPDILLGRKAASLPGTPAWMVLPFVGHAIYEQTEKDIINRTADFVITRDKTNEYTLSLLQKAGYEDIREAHIEEIGDIKDIRIWALPQTRKVCLENIEA